MRITTLLGRALAIVSLFSISLLMAGAARGQLTEAGVEGFLVQIESATERRDVKAVVDALADDVIILFRFSMKGDAPDMRFTKTQYRDFLASALASLEAHSARRYGTRITLSEDGMAAEVFANVEETTTMQGKTTVHVSQQTVLIVYQNGRMLVKRVFAEVVQDANET